MSAEINVVRIIEETLKWIVETKPFGIIHKKAPIKYGSRVGVLVWDYIIWNELTFVDAEDKSKLSLFTSSKDSETEAKFNELVSKYGI